MWTFKLPTEIIFGVGSIIELSARANMYGERKMIVTDEVLRDLPAIRWIIDRQSDAMVFSEVQPNPTVNNVDDLAARLEDERIDVVVAIGGGSVIDCSKAASCLAKSGENSVRPFHSEGKKFGDASLPLIAVPTTAGTGSEVTPFAVLDDTEKNIKGPIAAEAFYPKVAIVDPELACSVPRKTTAVTALDALSHAMEGYWSRCHQPICDVMALEAARLIFKNLGSVLSNPNDKAGRCGLARAALFAGIAFQLPKNSIMHACSFPLSSKFHLPHGAACAFTMEEAIRLNTPHMNGRMEIFAKQCGFESVDDLIAAVTELKSQGGLPLTIQDAGIDVARIDELIEASFHPLMANNPKEVTRGDLEMIYKRLGA